jgi:hypothetical protein
VKITQLSTVMTWPSKIILFLVIIFVEAVQNPLAAKIISGLFLAVYV